MYTCATLTYIHICIISQAGLKIGKDKRGAWDPGGRSNLK